MPIQDELQRILDALTFDSKTDDDEIEDEAHKTFRTSFEGADKLRMCALNGYDVPAEISAIAQRNGQLGAVTPKELTTLFSSMDKTTETGYKKAYSTMIHFEEAAQSQIVVQFNTKDIQLSYSGNGREFRIAITAKISAMVEAVEESMVDCFTLKSGQSSIVSLGGQIKASNKDFIFVEITEKDHCEYLRRNLHRTFDICFHVNRQPFQLQHHALDWIESHRLFDVFVNNSSCEVVDRDFYGAAVSDENYVFSGQLGPKLNKEQKVAAISIIQAQNMPLPYLLFGPAGTGKTRTLIAAVEEIVRSTNKCVLICANSNSACDEIAERLVSVLNFGEMFRMYAKSYDVRKVRPNLKPISNWLKGEFRFPSLKFLYQFRVLVCTLTTAGCLTRAKDDSRFDSSHFSHIMIDESASTHETVSMIPIAGLCTFYGGINSSIVLAGDPKQLDAVTKSDYAGHFGYRTSFMERLYEKPLYQKHPITRDYNHKYITKLVKNYRSHPSILAMPNKLFYDNELQANASADITDWFIGSKLLPSKNFPIILKTVQGFCKKSQKDFSMFNAREVDVVIDYIKKLLANDGISKMHITQSDIGVVTPYKLQCKVIARACRKNNFNDITIGTAEVFQGQERPVMIVSTVRTGGMLGFVKDPRRLNVIITRAKCLLIIVGDHTTLKTDPNWHQLVYYCFENDAIVR